MSDNETPQLRYESVQPDSGEPPNWIFVLHGIYGAGRNWATVMRRVVRSRPEWGARLIDLREHGDSHGLPGPHTLENAALDLERLAESIGHPRAVLGHSFGGKVALTWARTRPAELEQIWIVDAPLEASSPRGSAWEMLGVLGELPGPFDSRDEGVQALLAKGIAEPTARWMATNLEARDDAYHWRIDLGAMRELIEDFFAKDTQDVVESPPPGTEIHIVRALGASTYSDRKAEQIRSLAEQAPVFLHEVEGGHWLNAENPDAVAALLAKMLPSGS
jgi:pimeloyl-ACP methyl ester carboxylesterase